MGVWVAAQLFTVFLRFLRDGFQVFIQTLFEQIVLNVQLLLTGDVHCVYAQIWTATRKKRERAAVGGSCFISNFVSGKGGGSWGTYTHTACEGRWRRCWFLVCLPVTCRHRAQGEPAGGEQLRRIPSTRPFLKHFFFSQNKWTTGKFQHRVNRFSQPDRSKLPYDHFTHNGGAVRNYGRLQLHLYFTNEESELWII